MSLNKNIDNSSNNLFTSINDFNYNYRNLLTDCNNNKNVILKVNPNIKSTGINFQGINLEDKKENCQFLTLNAHPDFSSLSLEELRYNDYSLNQPDFSSNLKADNINYNKESNNTLLNNDDKDNFFISRNNNYNLDINNKNEVLKFTNNEEIDEDNKDGIIPNEDFKIEMSDSYINNAKKNHNSLIFLNNTSNNIKSERLLFPGNFSDKISIMNEKKFNNSSYNPKAIFCENKNNYQNNLNDSRNLMNFFQSKTFNNQIGNNDTPFLNNNLCDNSFGINDGNNNDIIEENENNCSSINMNMNNDKNSLVINMDKNKKNKINIEINDNKINIKINDDINIDINSSNNSLSINTNNININSNKNSISINTSNNAINNKSNFQSINVVNSRKNKFINNCKNIFNNKDCNFRNFKFQSANDSQKKVSNIFSLINKDENYIKENDQIIHSSENKIIYERSNSYDKNLILKMNNLESNLMMNSLETSSEMIKVNFHLKEPYNLSFKLDIKKSITVLELKKRIYQSLAQLNKECISLNNNSFFLMKNYNFIKEFGRIDESIICDGDDIYIILKENIKKCQNEE
jgi:hypothetical protein